MRPVGILLSAAVLSVMLCGCNARQDAVSTRPAIVEYPPVREGYAEENLRKQAQPVLYYANTSSGKFHRKDCTYAQKIANERLYICEDRRELINSGYKPCSICNP